MLDGHFLMENFTGSITFLHISVIELQLRNVVAVQFGFRISSGLTKIRCCNGIQILLGLGEF